MSDIENENIRLQALADSDLIDANTGYLVTSKELETVGKRAMLGAISSDLPKPERKIAEAVALGTLVALRFNARMAPAYPAYAEQDSGHSVG